MIVALITGSILTIANTQILRISLKPGRDTITAGAHPRAENNENK